jgi:transcriptional regulator with XRE-family HTH domain
MEKTFIGQNISYLIKQNNLTQSGFADIFDLKQSAISSYIGGTMPKIETIQNICAHFNISIDDFINRDLRDVKRGGNDLMSDNMLTVAETKSYEMAMFVIEKLEAQLKDKVTIIEMQRKQIKGLEKQLKKE